ncbi:MAG: GMC family oxidoreductase, partial [Planctomycetota bacterium]
AAANRVTLSGRRDSFGQELPHVHHQTTELDRRSLVELHRALAHAVDAAGVGRLDSDLDALAAGGDAEWPITQDASHHLGTTRMGDDPRTSVCDADGRVHGSDNVFCAGGSLFPTSGCANPTFTVVALSIRIAARLREELSRHEEPARP